MQTHSWLKCLLCTFVQFFEQSAFINFVTKMSTQLRYFPRSCMFWIKGFLNFLTKNIKIHVKLSKTKIRFDSTYKVMHDKCGRRNTFRLKIRKESNITFTRYNTGSFTITLFFTMTFLPKLTFDIYLICVV